jgi:hypothetical protein
MFLTPTVRNEIFFLAATFSQKSSKILILNKDGDWWKGEFDGQVKPNMEATFFVI